MRNAFVCVLKISGKIFSCRMNSLGTLRRVYWEWLCANSSSWCSVEANHFYFVHSFIYFFEIRLPLLLLLKYFF